MYWPLSVGDHGRFGRLWGLCGVQTAVDSRCVEAQPALGLQRSRIKANGDAWV